MYQTVSAPPLFGVCVISHTHRSTFHLREIDNSLLIAKENSILPSSYRHSHSSSLGINHAKLSDLTRLGTDIVRVFSRLIYAAEWVGKVLKLDLRILVCLWCNIHWHRDKVGAMNLVANLANFLHLRKNIRSPVFSIPLGHGARFSGSNPTTKLSIAYYSTQKKEEGQDVAKVESERFTELIEGMEEVEQEKRRVVKELKDAEVENGDDDDGGEGGSDSEEDE